MDCDINKTKLIFGDDKILENSKSKSNRAVWLNKCEHIRDEDIIEHEYIECSNCGNIPMTMNLYSYIQEKYDIDSMEEEYYEQYYEEAMEDTEGINYCGTCGRRMRK